MNTPINAVVAEMVEMLDDRLREDFEERAGIIEFDAELPRAHAECLALLDILHRHPSVLCGVTVWRVVLKDSDFWVLTTNPDIARQRLAEIGKVGLGEGDLATVINKQFNGIAVMTSIYSSKFAPF